MKYMKVGPRDNNFIDYENGLPYNYVIYAYENAKERQEALDQLWAAGRHNGMFCTRKEVEKYYGKNFGVNKYGQVRFYDDGQVRFYDDYSR